MKEWKAWKLIARAELGKCTFVVCKMSPYLDQQSLTLATLQSVSNAPQETMHPKPGSCQDFKEKDVRFLTRTIAQMKAKEQRMFPIKCCLLRNVIKEDEKVRADTLLFVAGTLHLRM